MNENHDFLIRTVVRTNVTNVERTETEYNTPGFELCNYPNPFNATTRIRVGVPADSYLSLVIVDVIGRTVKQLFQGMQTAGEHEYNWDGKNDSGVDLASGIYFAILNSKNRTQTVRMSLVR